MERMKTISFNPKRGSRVLHIEAPGCIINITGNLYDTEGREVVRIDVRADDYAGEPKATIPDVATIEEIEQHFARLFTTREGYGATLNADTIAREILSLEHAANSKRKFLGVRVRREGGATQR